MSDTLEKSPAPVVCVVEGARSTTSATQRRCCSTRKCVIGAVTSVMVVTMVIVGVLVAIKLTTDADLERLRIHRKSGEARIDEEYYQKRDSGEWLLKYHVTQPDGDTWSLTEFDKGVQVLKVQLKFGGHACFIVRQPVMNGTEVADKVRLSAADNDDSSEVINSPSNVTHVRFKIAIISGDVSALIGSEGQSFCDGLPIYAAIPDPSPQKPDSSTVNHGRQRRQNFNFYYRCFVALINCFTRGFPDSNSGPYFYCLPTCLRVFF